MGLFLSFDYIVYLLFFFNNESDTPILKNTHKTKHENKPCVHMFREKRVGVETEKHVKHETLETSETIFVPMFKI